MITNERQFIRSKSKLQKCLDRIKLLAEETDLTGQHAETINELCSESEILSEQLIRFQNLRDTPYKKTIYSFKDLAEALLQARISSRLNHFELGELLNSHKPESGKARVQKWEKFHYKNISLESLSELSEALGLEVEIKIKQPFKLKS